MKKHRIALTTLAAATALWASSASAQMNTNPNQYTQTLDGDTGTACEAVLCLAGGGGPSECTRSITKYFSIWDKKPWKTIEKRINFLNLCPSSKSSAKMETLVNAIGHGAGKCDAASLNRSLTSYRYNPDTGEQEVYISDQMPGYCSSYINHDFVDVKALSPSYVGEPGKDGRWTDPQGSSTFATTFPAAADMNNLDGQNNASSEAQAFQAAANQQAANASGLDSSLSNYQQVTGTSAYSDTTDYQTQMQNSSGAPQTGADSSAYDSAAAAYHNIVGTSVYNDKTDYQAQMQNGATNGTQAQQDTQDAQNSYDASLTNFNNIMNSYSTQGKP
jgi:TrbM